MPQKIYPRSKDKETVYLKGVVSNPNIIIGDYTMYNDFVREPKDFEKNNVLYQYPVNQDKLIIGKFCSIACGAKFIFNSANHSLSSLSTYPFPIFFEEWNLDVKDITKAWDNKGDIIIGNDVCNGVQREHNKKLNNGLPILHKVPPKRDYGRYFCILAEKGGTSHGGLTEKLSPFFYAQKQEVNAYGR